MGKVEGAIFAAMIALIVFLGFAGWKIDEKLTQILHAIESLKK